MDTTTAHSIYTVMSFVVFVAIMIWAWSGKRKQAFDEASRLPLEDDELVPTSKLNEESKHV
jgi:cytochrome c oxidase cbb3-type subunit 4